MSDLRESGCLPADARILRADTGAESTLGELYAQGATDVPVWALDDSLRYVRRHLTHVFPTGVKPVFRLTLASGKTVRATESHPFLAYQGWTQLGDLRTGSRVAVRRVSKPPLASGKTVRATESHPFLAYQGWTQLGDLRTGSRVAVPRHVPAPHELKDWPDDKEIG